MTLARMDAAYALAVVAVVIGGVAGVIGGVLSMLCLALAMLETPVEQATIEEPAVFEPASCPVPDEPPVCSDEVVVWQSSGSAPSPTLATVKVCRDGSKALVQCGPLTTCPEDEGQQ